MTDMIEPCIAAVVLAAGASSRMGRPKLLLPWGETTVLGQVLSNLSRSRVAQAVVVTGAEAEGVAGVVAECGAWGVATVHNADWAAGMMSSVRAGLLVVPQAADAVMIVLGDQPMIGAKVFDAVIGAYAAGRDRFGIAAPVHGGGRGHPVLFDRRFVADLLALEDAAMPSAVLARYPDAVQLVPVADEGVLVDLDRPQDYRRWAAESGGLAGE